LHTYTYTCADLLTAVILRLSVLNHSDRYTFVNKIHLFICLFVAMI